jgi:hypothetical protein
MRLLKLLTSLCSAAVLVLPAAYTSAEQNQSVTEALSGFDDQTNGFITQVEFDAEKATFEERETVADGLGPVYNAQSCAECHQNPVTGGISQVIELRAGHFDGATFHDHPGTAPSIKASSPDLLDPCSRLEWDVAMCFPAV